MSAKLLLLQLMRHPPAALRGLAGAYVFMVAAWGLYAIATVPNDPSNRPEARLTGAAGHTPGDIFVRGALLLLLAAFPIGLMWLCNEAVVADVHNRRVRAVLRWIPVVFVLALCAPVLSDDLRILSGLVITITP